MEQKGEDFQPFSLKERPFNLHLNWNDFMGYGFFGARPRWQYQMRVEHILPMLTYGVRVYKEPIYLYILLFGRKG